VTGRARPPARRGRPATAPPGRAKSGQNRAGRRSGQTRRRHWGPPHVGLPRRGRVGNNPWGRARAPCNPARPAQGSGPLGQKIRTFCPKRAGVGAPAGRACWKRGRGGGPSQPGTAAPKEAPYVDLPWRARGGAGVITLWGRARPRRGATAQPGLAIGAAGRPVRRPRGIARPAARLCLAGRVGHGRVMCPAAPSPPWSQALAALGTAASLPMRAVSPARPLVTLQSRPAPLTRSDLVGANDPACENVLQDHYMG